MNALDTSTQVSTAGGAARAPRPYAPMVIGAVLVGVGALWLLDATDVLELRAAIVLPAVLGIVGLALMVGASDGPHSGLIVFGVFLTIAVVAAAVTPEGIFRGGVGEREYRVTNQASLSTDYDVGVGDLRLDLSDLVLTESATVDVSVGAGQMRIELPTEVAVQIDASAGAGKIDLLGETSDGLSVSRTYTSPDFADREVTLTLDLHVGAGDIEVNR